MAVSAGRERDSAETVMYRRWALSLLAGLALLGQAGGASGAEDGRGGRFEDDLFSRLEGEWVLTRSIRGTEVRNAVTAGWVLQHQFLLVRMRDVATPSEYEADVYIGYSSETGEYVAHWLDNFGARYAAVGRGKRVGNSVEFRFEYPDGPFFNTFSFDPATGTWTCHLESVGADGQRTTFARDILVRKP
jgi:hypothetical protein